MNTKENYVKSLKNVKLILGNGFDLHCKRKTSYKDYFLSNKGKIDDIKKWINEFKDLSNGFFDYIQVNDTWKNFWCEPQNICKYNVWDYLFYFESKCDGDDCNDWNWFSVEDVIRSFLVEKKFNDNDAMIPRIEGVFKLLNRTVKVPVIGIDFSTKMVAAICFARNKHNAFKDLSSIYDFFLEELKLFENDFAEYVRNEILDPKHEKIFDGIYRSYNYFVNETFEHLINKTHLKSIDSFNYGFFNNTEYDKVLTHINGDWNTHSIFGIDSKNLKADDDAYIFTKTNRRIENDMNTKHPYINERFENIVVYGHSLDEADYSYFFSLFDKMKITDLTTDSKIIFAFDIFKKSKANEIKKDLRKRIALLFEKYSIYLGYKQEPQRLIDALSSMGKVIMYQIKSIYPDE